MNADEMKIFIKKFAFQLNKKLESSGHSVKIVPGRPSMLGPLVSEQEIQIQTYWGSYSIRPSGDFDVSYQFAMTQAPQHDLIQLLQTDSNQTLLLASRELARQASQYLAEIEVDYLSKAGDLLGDGSAPDEDISFNADFDYSYEPYYFERQEEENEKLEEERRQREAAEKSASNWKSLGVVLLVIFVIAAMSRCGGQTLPDNCEYIQDDRGGYTECT